MLATATLKASTEDAACEKEATCRLHCRGIGQDIQDIRINLFSQANSVFHPSRVNKSSTNLLQERDLGRVVGKTV